MWCVVNTKVSMNYASLYGMILNFTLHICILQDVMSFIILWIYIYILAMQYQKTHILSSTFKGMSYKRTKTILQVNVWLYSTTCTVNVNTNNGSTKKRKHWRNYWRWRSSSEYGRLATYLSIIKISGLQTMHHILSYNSFNHFLASYTLYYIDILFKGFLMKNSYIVPCSVNAYTNKLSIKTRCFSIGPHNKAMHGLW